MRLRSMLNPEEQQNRVEGTTRYKKGPNRWSLICSQCGGTFYVDEPTFVHAVSAMCESAENPFCCDECEATYDDVAH